MRLIWSSLLVTGLLLIAMDVYESYQTQENAPAVFEDGTGLPPPDPTPTPR